MTESSKIRDFSFALAGLRGTGGPTEPPPDINWEALLTHLDAHTLTPLLYSIWQAAPWWGRIPPAARARLGRAYADNARRQQAVRAEVQEINQILNGAGVAHIMLKGWSLVERLYADPAHRLVRDHDYLVQPPALALSYQALLAAGFQPLPGGDGAVDKHARPVWRAASRAWNGYIYDPDYPRPIELHTRLWDRRWRGLEVRELRDLWGDRQRALVAGESVDLLSDEKQLVHLAMHFAGHWIEREPRLSQLLDLARLLELTPGLDWEAIAQIADASLHRFLYASLWMAQAVFGARLPPERIWQRFRLGTPNGLADWLERHAYRDLMTIDYRFRQKGKDFEHAFGNAGDPPNAYAYRGRDYELTFLAARSLPERLGIAWFAAAPSADQLMAKYKIRRGWSLPWLYVRHLLGRLGDYGRAWLQGRV